MELELSDLVRDLRGELHRSMTAARDAPLRFELGPIELQVQFTVSRSGGAGGKVRFLVFEAGAEGEMSRSTVHSLKLTLTPTFADTGVKAWISDATEADEH